METFQILSDQFSHFQHLFHRWLAIFCIISSYIFDLSSSPPTWGIPAVRAFMAPAFPVHPHLRGAYRRIPSAETYSIGSSPHTWDIHRIEPECQLQDRFIPTYVGHTHRLRLSIRRDTVHPHIRGAYHWIAFRWNAHSGSSPHTWGIRDCGGPVQR